MTPATINDRRIADLNGLIDMMRENAVDREQRIAELEAENERLKVCGNCQHFAAEEFQYCSHPSTLDAGWDGDMPYYISAPDKCSFTPSRWAERDTP